MADYSCVHIELGRDIKELFTHSVIGDAVSKFVTSVLPASL